LILRPASTRWFEVLCPRSEGVHTVAELAATGAVEVEVRERSPTHCPIAELTGGLSEYAELFGRYQRYWERGVLRRKPLVEPPKVAIERGLARIHAWRSEADPLIDTLQACEEELTGLKWLGEILARIVESPLNFALVTETGPVLGTFCTILPADVDPKLPDWVIPRSVPWQDERCYMILGPADRLDHVKHQVKALKGRVIERPAWLKGGARESVARIAARRSFLSSRVVHLYAELDNLFEDYDLDDVLGALGWLAWFAQHVGALEAASDHLVWITGWTDDLSGASLTAALERTRSRALVRLTAPPAGARPPQVLDNPTWLKPFEPFVRAFGIPAGDEADPTPVLAVVVPILFGYMFGDVGQGLILFALGWHLRKRYPEANMLLPAGVSAMVFGLLFGSVFAREDLIPALWVHPLVHPLPVLAVPLIFAVGLLSLGQLLSGLGALWRGELTRWILVDLGFLVLYLGVIARVALGADWSWLPLLGAAWYLIGSFLAHHRLLGALAALGHLVEGGMQILVNTLSFARVGAFALAHASLSAAVVTMADAAPLWAGLLIMVLGNLLIIALEGLVVSIQTTRLVLFEFFNRFLRGSGRVFRPLPAPPELEAIS
jgi:V/A-type H+/Na+-transporting ATPase subunit I